MLKAQIVFVISSSKWIIVNEVGDVYNTNKLFSNSKGNSRSFKELSEAIRECAGNMFIISRIDSIVYEYLDSEFAIKVYLNGEPISRHASTGNDIEIVMNKEYGLGLPYIFVCVLSEDFKKTKKIGEGQTYWSIDRQKLEPVESIVDSESMQIDGVKFETEELARAYIRKMIQ